MEISDKTPVVNPETYTKDVKDRQKAEAPAAETPSGKDVSGGIKGDKVELSREARAFGDAKKVLASVPEVRQEKVEEIRQKIESGTYQVDGRKVAEKILKESLLNEIE